jgi:hypothetical protein
MKQQRRADVVGQIADNAQPRAQRRKIEAQRIGDMESQAIGCEFRGEARRQIPIDLDHCEAPGALEQRPRQRAKARADLYQVVAGTRIDGGDDAIDVMAVDQEVLAEPPPRDMVAGASSLFGRAQGIAARR